MKLGSKDRREDKVVPFEIRGGSSRVRSWSYRRWIEESVEDIYATKMRAVSLGARFIRAPRPFPKGWYVATRLSPGTFRPVRPENMQKVPKQRYLMPLVVRSFAALD